MWLIIIQCIAMTWYTQSVSLSLSVSLISLTVTHTYWYTHPAACAQLYAHYLFWFPWKPQPATAGLQGGGDTVCDYVRMCVHKLLNQSDLCIFRLLFWKIVMKHVHFHAETSHAHTLTHTLQIQNICEAQHKSLLERGWKIQCIMNDARNTHIHIYIQVSLASLVILGDQTLQVWRKRIFRNNCQQQKWIIKLYLASLTNLTRFSFFILPRCQGHSVGLKYFLLL